MKVELVLERRGETGDHQSSWVGEGEVAQIPQPDGTKIVVYGDPYISNGPDAKRKIFSGSIRRFAPDGKTQLPLRRDANRRLIRGALIEQGERFVFRVVARSEVPLMIQAGHGDPPSPQALFIESLGPTRRFDRVVVWAK